MKNRNVSRASGHLGPMSVDFDRAVVLELKPFGGHVTGATNYWTEIQKAHWKCAMRWRRAVEGALSESGLTFTQWLVLDALKELVDETADAAIQNQIAARVELDRGTISLVMRTLVDKHLVDRAPDITGRAWRALLTRRSASLLQEQTAEIEAASELAQR